MKKISMSCWLAASCLFMVGAVGCSEPPQPEKSPPGEVSVVQQAVVTASGWFSPTLAGSVGSDDWNNPTRAFADDALYASTNDDDDRETYSGFSWSIPAGATIDGFQVQLKAYDSDSTGCSISTRLRWASGSYTNWVSQGVNGTEQTYTLGGATNTWGRTWTRAEVLSSNFAVDVRYDSPGGCSGWVYLNHLTANVHYTTHCAAGTYESSPGTCTACPAGTYSGADAASCTPWTTCSAGQYVTNTPSATVDRTCTACASETFSMTVNAASCTPWTDCPAGEYVSAAGSATADRTCTACASETFSTTVNAASCTPWTDCPAGEYVSAAGSATADRTCTACASETFSTTANAASCTPWTNCPAGQYVTTTPSATVDRTCAACDGGFSTTDNAASCTSWTNCAAGQYAITTPSATADRTCASCAGGTFSTTVNAASCTSWTNCTAGQYVSAAGSATADRTCAACAGGFSATVNAASCTPWTNCTAGQYVSASGSASADRTCASCAGGTFSTTANTASCTTWRTCTAGQYVSAPGSATADRACASCAVGTFSTTANVGSCTDWTDCPAGQYESAAGSATADRTCTPCAAGTFSASVNSFACTSCSPGYIAASAGATECTACQSGWTSASPFVECTEVDGPPLDPQVTATAPSHGPITGGTTVTIRGTNFENIAVFFGDEAATSVLLVSSTEATAVTPAHAAGIVDVVVTNTVTGHSGTLIGGFTFVPPPSITSVVPDTGYVDGGTAVTIHGADFDPAVQLTLGGASITIVEAAADHVTFITPPHAAGAVDVRITNPDGQSALVAGGFTYIANPVIQPDSGVPDAGVSPQDALVGVDQSTAGDASPSVDQNVTPGSDATTRDAAVVDHASQDTVPVTTDDSSGCSCRVNSGGSGEGFGLLVLLLLPAIVLVMQRRRGRRALSR